MHLTISVKRRVQDIILDDVMGLNRTTNASFLSM